MTIDLELASSLMHVLYKLASSIPTSTSLSRSIARFCTELGLSVCSWPYTSRLWATYRPRS